MKNILARGGIEFLAVLFGITISLWVEDSRQNSDMQKKIIDDYKNVNNMLALMERRFPKSFNGGSIMWNSCHYNRRSWM